VCGNRARGLVLVFIWDPKILSRSAEDVTLRRPLSKAAVIDIDRKYRM
jgi:hypothetical protein